MAISVLTKASTYDLVTLAIVKDELRITDAGDDTRLARMITQASKIAERYCGVVFAREGVTETFTGSDRLRLVLSRTPIISVSEVRYDGTADSSDNYSIEDLESGFLYRAGRWNAAQPWSGGIAQIRLQEPGELLWAVDYVGGYYLPGFTLDGVITGASKADPVVIDDTAHGLLTGDAIRIAGVEGMVELNGNRYVITRVGADSFSLDDVDGTDYTAWSAGGTWAVEPTVPEDLEAAIISIVVHLFRSRGRDKSIKAEGIGDYSVQYGLPESLLAPLDAYARWA